MTRSSSPAVGFGSVPEAAPVRRFSLEAQQLSNTFADNSADPIELNFVAQSSSAAMRESSPQSIFASDSPVVLMSTCLPNSTAHSSHSTPQDAVDEAVLNLVAQARSRRRAQAKLMRSKSRRRLLLATLLEWLGVAAAASASQALSSVNMELLAQRCCFLLLVP